MFEAKVLADSTTDPSLTGKSHRLMSVQITFPRYLLSEFNTHRKFSRNSASSRAIPPEKQLLRILEEPFIPHTFYRRAKGMVQAEPIKDQDAAREIWLEARDHAVASAMSLITNEWNVGEHDPEQVVQQIAAAVRDEEIPEDWLDVSKTTVNRLLEPFMWHTVIVTSTEWDNFFSLRSPKGSEVDIKFGAEPEIQRIALLMREAMLASSPRQLGKGQWHLPLITDEEREQPFETLGWSELPQGIAPEMIWPMISAGRCARVSFDTHENDEPTERSFNRAQMLEGNGHLSPFEHVARPMLPHEFVAPELVGNLSCWVQLRKLIPHEANRVGHLEERSSWEETSTATA